MKVNILYAPLDTIPRSKVVIFVGDDCYPCKELLDYLFRAGVLFSEHIKVVWIQNKEEALEWALRNGIDEIPLVLINNNKVEGSNEEVSKEIVCYLLNNNLITKKELEENMRKVVLFNAGYLSEKLGKEIIVNEKMIQALVNKIIRHGLPYCPCRLKLSKENICPCEFSLNELRQYGRCKCGLFQLRSDKLYVALVKDILKDENFP